jgi:NDP-sugar pyrophosphorylase family protein
MTECIFYLFTNLSLIICVEQSADCFIIYLNQQIKQEKSMLTPEDFFAYSSFAHQDLLQSGKYVWDSLKNLKDYMAARTYADFSGLNNNEPLTRTVVYYNDSLLPADELTIEFGDATKGKLLVLRNGELLEGATVIMAGAVIQGSQLQLGKSVLIEPGAMIKSPAIIGDNTEIRQGAYLRGFCLVGKRCVVGHVTEVKHTIFLDDAKAGHFAYLGDSILGNEVNLGAGTKLANLRFTSGDVQIRNDGKTVSTGLRKLGAILGDQVQTGCNSVTNPGTLMGKKSILMPNTTAPSGLHKASSLIR